MYPAFTTGFGVNPSLNGGFWVESLVTNGIPPFVLRGVNIAAFVKHVLSGPHQPLGSQISHKG